MRAFTRSAVLSLILLAAAAGNALAGHGSGGSGADARALRTGRSWLPMAWSTVLPRTGAGDSGGTGGGGDASVPGGFGDRGGFAGRGGSGGSPACRPVAASAGYVNPLAGTSLKRERIDQGVDYAGSGKLTAIGRAELTYVGTTGTGWPGAFIEYRLMTGRDAGCFVYYAEGITPADGLHVGQVLRPGQVVAAIIPWWPTGIELGWGAGISTKTYAAVTGAWSARDDADSVATDAGKSFSALIAKLGGPPGKVEG